jgi:hypothetical protein
VKIKFRVQNDNSIDIKVRVNNLKCESWRFLETVTEELSAVTTTFKKEIDRILVSISMSTHDGNTLNLLNEAILLSDVIAVMLRSRKLTDFRSRKSSS